MAEVVFVLVLIKLFVKLVGCSISNTGTYLQLINGHLTKELDNDV